MKDKTKKYADKGGNTYIYHGIRGDTEQRGPLCHLTDLIPSFSGKTQTVQFW